MADSVTDMDSARADRFATEFAGERKLSPDDPIVIDLRRGIKSALARGKRRNQRDAEMREMQPSLLSENSAPVLAMKKRADRG